MYQNLTKQELEVLLSDRKHALKMLVQNMTEAIVQYHEILTYDALCHETITEIRKIACAITEKLK